jgi:hypothetical protein
MTVVIRTPFCYEPFHYESNVKIPMSKSVEGTFMKSFE